jgi:hypothetical protein
VVVEGKDPGPQKLRFNGFMQMCGDHLENQPGIPGSMRVIVQMRRDEDKKNNVRYKQRDAGKQPVSENMS